MGNAGAEQPIRDAATLVIVDRSAKAPRVLMGRRRADQVFLPNLFVFPGGRVDAGDALAPSCDALPDAEARLLALPRDGHAAYDAAFVRGLALAAIRETFEETGFACGVAGAAREGGMRAPESWRGFLAQGVVPRLQSLRYFLRAITPPARPRRYDTRFFLVDAREIASRGVPSDEELSEVGWFAMEELAHLDVPRITRVVIREVERCLVSGLEAAETRQIPFYFEQNDVMRRAELSLSSARS